MSLAHPPSAAAAPSIAGVGGPGVGARPPSTPAEKPGFRAGIAAFFGGLGFIVRTPGVWPLAMVPVAVALVLSGALVTAAIAFVPGWIAALIGASSGAGRVAVGITEVLGTVLASLAGVVAGFALAQPLSGPALERIVRRHEAELGAPAWPPTSAVSDVLRSLQSVAVSFLFAAPLFALLFVLDLTIPGAAVVCVPLKVVLTAILIAWDLLDYPLSIRGVAVGKRVAFVGRNVGAMLGFSLGLALLSFLPCLLLLLLPAGGAGAARLTFELERYERLALPSHEA